MSRIKVALDANVPERVVRMLNSGFGGASYAFHWEPDFAPANSPDEFWAVTFRRFGGSVIITGDKNIARRPHQIAAFQTCGLAGYFCASRWNEFDLAYKCAHIIRWWPEIQKKIDGGDRKSWWIPGGLAGTVKEVRSPDNSETTGASFGESG